MYREVVKDDGAANEVDVDEAVVVTVGVLVRDDKLLNLGGPPQVVYGAETVVDSVT